MGIGEERLLILVPLLYFLQALNLLVKFAYTINTPAGTYKYIMARGRIANK
jgi:hypothetical protein